MVPVEFHPFGKRNVAREAGNVRQGLSGGGAMINAPVLLVDDNGTMRRILRNLLEQIGFLENDKALKGADTLE